MSEGTQNTIRVATESAWGTIDLSLMPAAGQWLNLRKTGDAGIMPEVSQLKSEQLNSRRAVTDFRLGLRKGKATIPFELSATTYDLLFESAFMSAWSTPASAVTGCIGSISSVTKALTLDKAVPTGLAVGAWVKILGFPTNARNNGFHKVTALNVTVPAVPVITFGEDDDLVTENSVTGLISITPQSYLVAGSLMTKSLAFEEEQTDASFFQQVLGAMCDTLTLNIQPDQLVKGRFDFLAKSYSLPQATRFSTGTPTAADENQIITSNDAFSYLTLSDTVGGAQSKSTAVTGFDLSLKNALQQYFPILGTPAARMGKGDSDMTGTATMFLDSAAYWIKYLNEVAIGLTTKILQQDGAKGYAIDIPQLKFSNPPTKQSTKENVLQSLAFQVLEAPAKAYPNAKLWKLL